MSKSDQKIAASTPMDCPSPQTQESAQEFGGPEGKEPTRYGDWEKQGRCIDF